MTSFSVVIVAKEDHSIIERLVDYYLGIGAKHITIYFDGTADFEPVERPDLFTFIECTEPFWKEIGHVRPDALEQRQAIFYRHALDRTDADWLLLVDSDEILAADEPVGQALDLIPAGVDVLRVPNAEAVWSPDDDPNVDFGTRSFRWPNKAAEGVFSGSSFMAGSTASWSRASPGTAPASSFCERTAATWRFACTPRSPTRVAP